MGTDLKGIARAVGAAAGIARFEDYLPAWRIGWEGRARHPGRNFEDLEHDLKAEFPWNRGQSRLLWEQARPAARAAWNRV